MRTVFAFITFLSLLLVLFGGSDVVARKEAVGGSWKKAIDSQPMPEAIQDRIHPQTGKRVYFVKDFDPKSLSAGFHNYLKPNTAEDLIHPEARPKAEENSSISKAKP
ncbi:uncharacterized protein LOC133860160 [Alnus glutinosa]|uniref:uncharacterized protein LOC133860160 n=1 Tax=Alnus glutinosa TaxID=3517 RepID=UPI002D78E63A|nr:uncharacterized protein LOC133860160 [Alnus glutinosa]